MAEGRSQAAMFACRRLAELRVVIAFFALVCGPAPARAQVGGTTATLRGTVRDATGAVAPGAAITLTDVGTMAVRVLIADESGGFVFSGLFPAGYDLRVALDGFKIHEEKGLVLGPNDTRGLDIRLDIGDRTETVTVSSPAEYIQTETGAREGRITAAQIDHLSVIGRSPLELLRILPGVVAPDQSQLESVSFGGGANCTACYTINGIRSTNNTVSLDGSNLVDIGANSGTMITLNDDMVQEVKVQSSNFAAEFGVGGMNFSAVTKSGASHMHGAAYWYDRDYHLAANDRSNVINHVERPKSLFNYAGGDAGGPLRLPGVAYAPGRNKFFFWIGVEAQRQKVDPGSHLSTTISEAARRGDLSEFLANRGQNLNHPVQVRIPGGFPDEGTPAPGNDLTPYVTPLGRALANLYPLPNYDDPDHRYNYVYSALVPTNRVEATTRVDWNISSDTKAYVRLALDAEDVESPLGVWCGCSAVSLATPSESRNRGRSYATTVTSVLSATLTNEVLASFSRLTLDNSYADPSKIRQDALGVDFEGLFPDQSPYVPMIHNHSWGGAQLGDYLGVYGDVYAHNDELLLADKLTKIHGAHALKVGASVARLQKQQNFNNFDSGALIFAPGATPGSTGSQIGDLLVGRPFQIQQGTRIKDGRFRMWNVDGFVQDSWKVRSHLTIEYGVRLGYWTNNAEQNGLGAWFDPGRFDPAAGMFLDPASTQLNGVRYAAHGQAPLGLLANRAPFALPRINVAWDISGNSHTVLRGGYGQFRNRPFGNVEYNTLFIPPNAYFASVDAYYDPSLAGVGLTYDTVHLVPYAALLGSQTINTPAPRSHKFPRTDSYSISIARRTAWSQIIEAAYVGTTGRDLVSQINENVVPFGALSRGVLGNADLSVPVNRVNLDSGLINTLRPFPVYGPVYDNEFEGRSQYHSLQLTVSRQTGRHLQYFAAYTLSRLSGTINGDYGLRDPFDASRTSGMLDADRRHILNLSWNAFLPDAAHGPLDRALGRTLLNGWQLSGISTLASGVPLRLGFSGDAAGPGVSQAYFGTPDVVGTDTLAVGGQSNGLAPAFTCDPRLDGSRPGDRILNIHCIEVPDFGRNAPLIGPYDLRTPMGMNHDVTLFKTFTVHAAQKLQFRAGLFNVFNMAHATTTTATDVDLTLETTCNRRVDHVPNGLGGYADGVCDPTGGYAFTPNTVENFGRINTKRGHRIIELAVKYTF